MSSKLRVDSIMPVDGVTATGGGGSHNHGFSNPSLNLNVAYIDVIVATKD